MVGRGALQYRRSPAVKRGGGAAKANVGMSNDKTGEKPVRRKTKGSSFYANQNRVSRDLRRTRKGQPMASRSTFRHPCTLRWGDEGA